MMTAKFRQAFERAQELPLEDQDRLASQVLAEIEDELRWNKAFADSQDVLDRLAERALEEHGRGHSVSMGK
jgi:hypothetical protein